MKFLRTLMDMPRPLFEKGGKLEKLHALYEATDTFLFTVPSHETPRIQEAHDAMSHCLVEAVDESLALLKVEQKLQCTGVIS